MSFFFIKLLWRQTKETNTVCMHETTRGWWETKTVQKLCSCSLSADDSQLDYDTTRWWLSSHCWLNCSFKELMIILLERPIGWKTFFICDPSVTIKAWQQLRLSVHQPAEWRQPAACRPEYHWALNKTCWNGTTLWDVCHIRTAALRPSASLSLCCMRNT